MKLLHILAILSLVLIFLYFQGLATNYYKCRDPQMLDQYFSLECAGGGK